MRGAIMVIGPFYVSELIIPRGQNKVSVKKEIKYLIIRHLLTSFSYYALALYAKTIKLRLENKEELREHLKNNGMVILCSWHQRFFGGFYLPRIFDESPCIMISQSRDGDFIAGIVRRIGWIPVRGSNSRGGRKALQQMIARVSENRLGGHIVDGPTGPPRVVKPGVITLAQKSGAALCPAYISYEKPWIFNSWDRFMIPRPFSRILIRFGSLEFISKEMNTDEFEDTCRCLEQRLTAGYKEADRCWRRAGHIQ